MGTGEGGGTKGCDYILDIDGYDTVSYFGNIFNTLKQKLGYQSKKTLWAAPFDWRVSPGNH